MEEFQHSHKELLKKRETFYSEMCELKRYLEVIKQKRLLRQQTRAP